MSIEQLKIVVAGSKSLGLSLVGDRFIGFKFCDGDDDIRQAANELLQTFFSPELLNKEKYEYTRRNELLDSLKDEDYSPKRWEAS